MLLLTASAIDRAIDIVKSERRPGRQFLFQQVEPLFFSLTAIHRDYLKVFDRAILLMEAAEHTPDAAYNELQQMIADFLPVRQKVHLLTYELKQSMKKSDADVKDPFSDLIRKINWYFHMGFGGIAKSRLMMANYSCLYDILQDWRGDFTDYTLLEEARKLRNQLASHWSTLCTSYTRVKLSYLKSG
ncbi:MAG: hypothetical protein ABIL58_27440 [Pseudomonadota bacterium]